MSPEDEATLAKMAVSQRIEEYRRRAGELTSAELAVAISLIRKERTAASSTRTAKARASVAKSGKSADDLLNDLDSLK